jgi:hypothetical protein
MGRSPKVDSITVDQRVGFWANLFGTRDRPRTFHRAPLTFSVDREPRADPYRVETFAVRVVEIAPLLVEHAKPTIVVLDVAHHSSGADGNLVHPLEIARAVDPSAVGYRMDTPYGEVALARGALPEFLSRLEHYDLELEDASEPPPASESGCPAFSDRDVYVRSHDDCFLTVESRSTGLVTDVLRVTLASFFGTHLLRRPDADRVTLSVPPRSVVEALIANSAVWTSCTRAAEHGGSGDAITALLAPVHWQGLDYPAPAPVASATARVTYDVGRATWAVGR